VRCRAPVPVQVSEEARLAPSSLASLPKLPETKKHSKK
jgi:hypothetical protein